MKYLSVLLGLFLICTATASFADCREKCNKASKKCVEESTAATMEEKEKPCLAERDTCVIGCTK